MKKIFIADDEVEIRELIKEKLQQSGYEALVYQGGKELLNAAVSLKPELVILDIAMPQMNGYEICHNLRKNPLTKEIPVLFFP